MKIMIPLCSIALLISVIYFSQRAEANDLIFIPLGSNEEVRVCCPSEIQSGEIATLRVSLNPTSKTPFGWSVCECGEFLFLKDTVGVAGGIVYYKGETPIDFYVKARKK